MARKMNVLSLVVGCALVGCAFGPAFAQAGHDHNAMMQGSMPGMSHESMSATATTATVPQGVVIREAKVQGLSFVYRLYSWDERNILMKGMEGMVMPGMDATGKATNHLMVFVKGDDGKDLSGGKVGFILTGPDKAEQKTLTMEMDGGYGADVALKAPGSYAVKTKAVFGDHTAADDFSYTVK